MIHFQIDKTKLFQMRIAGLLIHDDHVLLHRNVKESFWALPGGRAEWGEATDQTIVREWEEELGWKVETGKLLWVTENFFPYRQRDFHEINFIYRCFFAPNFEIAKAFQPEPFGGEPGAEHLEFRWFALEELDNLTIYPSFLKERLVRLPDTTEHEVVVETTVE